MALFKKDKDGKLDDGSVRKLMIGLWACGVIALLLSVLNMCQIGRIEVPEQYSMQTEISRFQSAQNWGADYMLLYLAGTPSSLPALKARTSAPGEISLPTVPLAVQDIRPGTVEYVAGSPDAEWSFLYRVRAVVPGASSVRTSVYRLIFVEHENSYQVIKLPESVSEVTTPFRSETVYVGTADPSSALGKATTDFLKAFLTGGDNGSLGRTVSGDFKGTPLQGSPFTVITVTSIHTQGSVPSNPESGATVKTLVTVKASITGDSWQIQQYALTMKFTDQGQWVVDKVSDVIDFGASVPR